MSDQAKKLRQMLHHHDKKAKTISVVSGKGGVGKSNTSLNFALQLLQLDFKVLLIDLDIGMGNIDILVGNDANYSIANLSNDYSPINDIIELGPNNLNYIAGGTSLEEIVHLRNEQLQFFFDEMEKAVQLYDYILFDLGAGVSEAALSFILASDECIVLTTPEPTAITDAYSMMKHIIQRNNALPMNVLINRCKNEREGKQTMMKFTKVIEHFLQKEVKPIGILPEDSIVTTAVIKQVPYTILNQHASISKAMKTIVESYVTGDKVDSLLEERGSFILRLKKMFGKG